MTPDARTVLMVDDDHRMTQELAACLSLHGHHVRTAGRIADAERMLAMPGPPVDAILLDVGLPDGDGRDFCANLRRRGWRLPVMLLTGCAGEVDIVHGLACGANDYIAKPCRLHELLARLRSHIRVHEESGDARLVIGDLVFHPTARMVRSTTRGRDIRLTEKEAALLKRLYHADNEPIHRQVLLDDIWGYCAAARTHTLETHIWRLRRKIELHSDQPRLVVSEPPGSYRLERRPAACAAHGA